MSEANEAARRPTLFAPANVSRVPTVSRPNLFRRATATGAPKQNSLNRRKTTNQKVNMFEKPQEKPSLWVNFSWFITCCCPSALLNSCGVHTNSQQAWREKVALCFIAFLLMAITVFILVFFSNVLCPASLTDNVIPINAFGGVVIFGTMYNSITMTPPFNALFEQTDAAFGGIDVSQVFSQPNVGACTNEKIKNFAFASFTSPCEPNCLSLDDLKTQSNLKVYDKITGKNNKEVKVNPQPAYEWKDVLQRRLVAYQNTVLNFNPYFVQNPDPIPNDPVDQFMRQAQSINDATRLLELSTKLSNPMKECLVKKYYAGVLSVLPTTCILSRLLTWTIAGVILSILLFRFAFSLIFAWFVSRRLAKDPSSDTMINNYDNVPASKPLLSQLTPKDRKNVTPSGNFFTGGIDKGVATLFKKPGAKSPAPHPADLFAVLLVTCYSEGKEGIKATLDSLAATNYDDRKKLLFVVADGLVQGSGNAQSTPDILISMMDHDPRFGMQPLPQSYVAVGTGSKQHNMAKVYCGCYTYEGRAVPMVLIVKCGTPDEQSGSKPGNRGKRDSQLILMNFFSRVTLNDRMTPLDFDLFRKIHHISGVTPDFYELVLMVDADTMVEPSSVRYLINAVQNDQSIMGLCGETRIENKKASWVTAIQVFEYFISHQMGKAFESVFGGVTCLPGCFSMWRIKSVTRDGTTLPIIANPDILEQYSTNDVYTLHQKNLLLLGEDRFLTTIMLKQFPNRKTVFIPQAVCKTVVPDDFKTLLSQRRRWINSTIHNLMELVMVDTLCGTFCFSMQFVVLMDLLSTAVMPAGLVVTYYLVFSAIFQVQYSTDNITALIMTIAMAVVIFLPAFVVLLTGRRISYVLWMLIYLLALPVWQIILPIYAFWNFDDFSWGETRKVEGHVESKSGHDEGDGSFIASRVAFKRWDQYEREWRRTMIPEDLRRNNSFVREDGRESTVFTDTSN